MKRTVLSALAALTLATTGHALPVVSVQNGWLWYGLTPGGNLVSIYCHPSRPEFIKCHARTGEERDKVLVNDLVAEGRVLENASSYNLPVDQMDSLSKEEKTEQGAQASLTRISTWTTEKSGETSIAGGLQNGPEATKIFAEKLRRVTEEALPSIPAGVIVSVNAERIVGPAGETYAQLLEKSGRKFITWVPHQISLPVSIAGVCNFPETMEVLSDKDMAWMKAQLAPGEDSILVRVEGKAVQLILLGPPTKSGETKPKEVPILMPDKTSGA